MMARTIWVSIAFALIVQGIALVIARSFPRDRVMVGWGVGSILRLVMLLAYGWGIAPVLGFSLAPALITVVAVFFVTTLVEPFLLTSNGPERQGPRTDS
jgi:hypothetical protein